MLALLLVNYISGTQMPVLLLVNYICRYTDARIIVGKLYLQVHK